MNNFISEIKLNYNEIDDFDNKLSAIDKFQNLKSPDWNNYDFALLGVDNNNSFKNSNAIRKSFYDLYKPSNIEIVDLGNFLLNDIYNDFTKLYDFFKILACNNVKIITFGDSLLVNLLFFNYFEGLKLPYSNLHLSPFLNFFPDDTKKLNKKNFLNYFLHNSKFIQNNIILGYQNYLINFQNIEKFKQKGFFIYRLGEIKSDFLNFEPDFRNTEIISFDLSSVKFSDAPGTVNTLPNGFNAFEICKLANYAGISDNIKFFSLNGFNFAKDINNVSANLSAQIIWHIIYAFSNKKKYLNLKPNDYSSYFLKPDNKKQFKFVHCKKTDRWWFALNFDNYEKLLPCSLNDYLKTKKGSTTKRINYYLKNKTRN